MHARTWVLREPRHAADLVAWLKEHAGQAAADEQPLQVTVSRFRPKRSDQANRFLWGAVLEQIAAQACVSGRHFRAEVWHEHYKRELLPERTASGKDKWDWLPSGERVLAIGTKDLNSSEFSTYLEQVQADAATVHGVSFDSQHEGDAMASPML
jgi:hypothetical protein